MPGRTKANSGKDLAGTDCKAAFLALGRTQVDAMFSRQEISITDDSEFAPRVEAVLTTFQENRDLMRSYMLGPRGLRKRGTAGR